MNYISIVRAKLKGANPQQAHDSAVEKLSAMTRPMGAIGHRAYLSPQDASQFVAIDTWNNIDGLQKFMSNPEVAAELGKLFEGMPDITIWSESGWASFAE